MTEADTKPIAKLSHFSVLDRFSGKKLVSDVSFEVLKGECLSLVGESGSGKSLCCRALMGLLPLGLQSGGQAFFGDIDMLHVNEKIARNVRGTGISAILQQPMTAFDPLYTVGNQIEETLKEKLDLSKTEARKQTFAILDKVHLADTVFNKYPHELSGGMLQRCMIGLSLALESKLVVADEPTTALDAENQYEVLQRLARMRKKYGTTLIFVSHDLGAVQMLADKVVVMHKGYCVEQGEAQEIFNHPQNEYTRHLVKTRLDLTRAFNHILGELHEVG